MPKTAIVLAAGEGTRFRPLTYLIPKPKIPVQGKPMIETQIEFLIKRGIDEIIVVTGYKHWELAYLAEQYKQVKLVHNEKYKRYNNIYTMFLVRDYLKQGAYVLEGDIHLTKNIIPENPTSSFYMSARKPHFKKEWIFDIDPKGKITDINVGDGHNQYIMCGISYWAKDDAEKIVAELERIVKGGHFDKNFYWDDVVKSILKSLDVHLKPVPAQYINELDSLDEWRDLEMKLDRPSAASFMARHGMFKKLEKMNEEYLEENRHQSPELQKAYDSRFGLVVRR